MEENQNKCDRCHIFKENGNKFCRCGKQVNEEHTNKEPDYCPECTKLMMPRYYDVEEGTHCCRCGKPARQLVTQSYHHSGPADSIAD